ncbi:unnamed protein product [Parajaminaea phylloscopi]
MPLHLAHHKSYHPYNRDNIERVQRDEAEAQRKQQAREEQARTADSEARVQALRRRQPGQGGSAKAQEESEVDALPASTADVHAGHEQPRPGRRLLCDEGHARNKGRPQDIGVYLDAVKREGHAWYDDVHLKGPKERRKTQDQRLEDAYKDSARKSSNDPLKAMSAFLAQREAARKGEETPSSLPPSSARDSISSYRHYVDPRSDATERRRGESDFRERPGDPDPGGPQIATQGDGQLRGTRVGEASEASETNETNEAAQNATAATSDMTALVALDAAAIKVEATPHTPTVMVDAGMIKEEPGLTDIATIPQVETSPHDDSVPPAATSRSRSASFAGESMYPTLLGEMIETVLKHEAYLFDEAEVELLKRYGSLPYEARYLFARLIQRKDSWLRVEALKDSYGDEITDTPAAISRLTCRNETDPLLITHADAGDDAQEAMLNLLTLDELKTLAKRMHSAKAGTTKASIIAALRSTKSQGTLTSLFAPPSPSRRQGARGAGSSTPATTKPRQLSLNFTNQGKKASQSMRLANEVTRLLGALVKVAPATRSLIDRIALVFYRGAMLGGTALTTAVLARSRRRNYPQYQTQRSPRVYPSREHLLAFEEAIAVEVEMEELLQWGDNTEATFAKALKLFEMVWPVWKNTVAAFDHEVRLHGRQKETSYHRMRFHAGWPQTRVVYKGTTVLARFKLHDREEEVLRALLGQRHFRRGRRGEWYDRLALITAMYSYPSNKIKGKQEALKIAIAGIEDPDTHLIYHDQLQRRICRLENQLPIPKGRKHDFSYAKLKKCEEQTFGGIRLDSMDSGLSDQSLLAPLSPTKGASPGKESNDGPRDSGFQYRAPLRKVVKVERPLSPVKALSSPTAVRPSPLQRSHSSSSNLLLPSPGKGTASPGIDVEGVDEALLAQYEVARKEKRTSMHSVWRGLDGNPCRVEDLVLQHYAARGYVGVHDEGGVLKMLFALCMWDIIFASGTTACGGETDVVDVSDVFETPYQRAPLDMDQDSFAVTRGPLIRSRLASISSGAAPSLVAEADDRERPRKTWAIGCRWDSFTKEQLVEVATLIPGSSLAVVFQMMTEEWSHCSGGMPDLLIWKPAPLDDDEDVQPRFRPSADEDEGPVVKLCEVKGPGDRLSETQKVWIDVLCRAGIQVEVSLVREADDGADGASPVAGLKRARSQSQSPVKKSFVTVSKREG